MIFKKCFRVGLEVRMGKTQVHPLVVFIGYWLVWCVFVSLQFNKTNRIVIIHIIIPCVTVDGKPFLVWQS